MLGIVASNRRRGGTGGQAAGPYTTPQVVALFGPGVPGAAFDFTDGSKLAVNADGSGGSPAVGAPCKWAIDLGPNGKHLRNTVGSVIRRATGLETSGTNFGLFNFATNTADGNWAAIAAPFEVIVCFEQIAFAGNDARVIDGGSFSLVQGPASGDVRMYAGGYGPTLSPGLNVETAVALATGVGGINDLLLGSDRGGGTPTQTRFKRLAVIGRPLTQAERAGVLGWVSA